MNCKKPAYLCMIPGEYYRKFVNETWFNNNLAIAIKCNNCFNCKKQKQIRIEHLFHLELLSDDYNYLYFITLTYSNADYLDSFENYKKYLDKWLKRLRKNSNAQLKYLITTELGSNTYRLHHHALLLSNKPLWKKAFNGTIKNGNYYYSADCSWNYGYNSTSEIDIKDTVAIDKTLKYVTKYVLKEPIKILKSNNLGKKYIESHLTPDKKGYYFNGKIYFNPKQQEHTLSTKEIIYYNKLAWKPQHIPVDLTLLDEPDKDLFKKITPKLKKQL